MGKTGSLSPISIRCSVTMVSMAPTTTDQNILRKTGLSKDFFLPQNELFFHNTRKILCLIHSVTAKSCKLNLLSSKRHTDMTSAQSDQCSLIACLIEGFFVRWLELSLVLLNPDISCFCKQCRSRCGSALFAIYYVNIYQGI